MSANPKVQFHILPCEDLVQHDCNVEGDCVCGPTAQPMKQEDGAVDWVVVHHALDGRL